MRRSRGLEPPQSPSTRPFILIALRVFTVFSLMITWEAGAYLCPTDSSAEKPVPSTSVRLGQLTQVLALHPSPSPRSPLLQPAQLSCSTSFTSLSPLESKKSKPIFVSPSNSTMKGLIVAVESDHSLNTSYSCLLPCDFLTRIYVI